MAYSKIEGRKLTVTINMKKSESKSAPYILHGRGRGLSDDWIENADGLRPIPPTAELRELEPFVGRGRHRLLPPGGEKEALIGQLHGRGNVRQQNQIDRTRRRSEGETTGCTEIWGFWTTPPFSCFPLLIFHLYDDVTAGHEPVSSIPFPACYRMFVSCEQLFLKLKQKTKKNKKVSSYIPLLLWKQRI